MTANQVEEGLGMTPHEFKDSFDLGESISHFDIYREGNVVYLVKKDGQVIETGYVLPGS